MKPTRLYAAGPLAAVCTSGLFLVMQGLVGGEGEVQFEPDKQRFIPVLQDIVDEPPKRIERNVIKPPEPQPKPPKFAAPPVETGDPTRINISIPGLKTGSGTNLITINLGEGSDGDYLPLVRVQPQYPRRAQEQGIEGYVIVELTVSPDGSVPPESVVVVDTEPAGYFETNSIKAAQKFKYKPKVVNGQGQTVTGVRYKFSFNMAK